MIYAIHPAGKLTVTPEGAYLHFHAEAPQMPGLLRLWLSGGGSCESLGLMEPRGGRLVLDRRLSRRELAASPPKLSARSWRSSGRRVCPRGSLRRCRRMLRPTLYGAVTPERGLSRR